MHAVGTNDKGETPFATQSIRAVSRVADAEASESGTSTVKAESLLCGFPGISLQIYGR